MKVNFAIKEFDVDVDECVLRDAARGENSVGESVIRNMFNYSMYEKEIETIPFDPKLPKCIICDIDGTLAQKGKRSPYDYSLVKEDRCDPHVLDILKTYQDRDDVHIFFFTGRENETFEDTVQEMTHDWLDEQWLWNYELHIRQCGDHRNDALIKEEMYEKNVEWKFNVLFWLDDRERVVKAIRKKGIKVLQCQYGKF